MIQDADTNFVYLSEWLEPTFKGFYREFTALLDRVGIPWGLLPHTNDYWARDYMPLQRRDGSFLKYRYQPDYLLWHKSDRQYITNCRKTCNALDISPQRTHIVLDGGNVVPCGDCVVMTQKVFPENRKPVGDKAFHRRLEQTLGCKVIIIPWQRHGQEWYGHSDGFLHYAGDNHILLTNHADAHPDEARQIRSVLEDNGFEVTELRFNVPHPNPDYNWAYINLLQVGHDIIFPVFGIEEDAQALAQIQQVHPTCRIHPLPARPIATRGGCLHCITWNIRHRMGDVGLGTRG